MEGLSLEGEGLHLGAGYSQSHCLVQEVWGRLEWVLEKVE